MNMTGKFFVVGSTAVCSFVRFTSVVATSIALCYLQLVFCTIQPQIVGISQDCKIDLIPLIPFAVFDPLKLKDHKHCFLLNYWHVVIDHVDMIRKN